jgi:hypothetical protein
MDEGTTSPIHNHDANWMPNDSESDSESDSDNDGNCDDDFEINDEAEAQPPPVPTPPQVVDLTTTVATSTTLPVVPYTTTSPQAIELETVIATTASTMLPVTPCATAPTEPVAEAVAETVAEAAPPPLPTAEAALSPRTARRLERAQRALDDLLSGVADEDRNLSRGSRKRKPPTRFLDDRFPEGKTKDGRMRYWEPGKFMAREYASGESTEFLERFRGRLAHDIVHTHSVPATVLVDTTDAAEANMANGSAEAYEKILATRELPAIYSGPETSDEEEEEEEEEDEYDFDNDGDGRAPGDPNVIKQ